MTSRSRCLPGTRREGSRALINSFHPGNSPFVVGLVCHPDLESAQIAPLIQATIGRLLDIKQRLPDTDVRLMLDARNEASLAIARATLGLEINVDALGVAAAPGNGQDLLNHPQVRWIELDAHSSEAMLADILTRRASLLLACWDGNPSKVSHDTADQVYRFLGVAGDQHARRAQLHALGCRIRAEIQVGEDFEVAGRHHLLESADHVLDAAMAVQHDQAIGKLSGAHGNS